MINHQWNTRKIKIEHEPDFSSQNTAFVFAPVKYHSSLPVNPRCKLDLIESIFEWCFPENFFVIQELFAIFLCVFDIVKIPIEKSIVFFWHLEVIRLDESCRDTVSIGITESDVFF